MQADNPQELVKNLQQAIAKDDAHAIYTASNALLTLSPDDPEYKHCYAIAAIKLSLFSELSSGIFKEKPNDKDKDHKLENIYYYYLYRSGNFKKCIEHLSGSKDPSLQLLLSQAYFKAMQYEKSAKIMSNLLKNASLNKDEKETYVINLLAASGKSSNSYIKDYNLVVSEQSCKEMFYNYCLWLFQNGEIDEAMNYLNKFEMALEKDDEIDWLTVKLLRDYLGFRGKRAGEMLDEKKEEEYNRILKTVQDSNLKCVVNTNLGFLNPHEAESLKMIEEFFQPNYKISIEQGDVLKMNKLSMLLRKNRITEGNKLMKELEDKPYLLENQQYIRSNYLLLKKGKQESQMQKFIAEVNKQKPFLGFCLMADYALEKDDQKRILQALQDKSQSSHEAIKNFIFSLLIQDENLFEEYETYLSQLIEKSNETGILEVLLKLYQNKNDQGKQIQILKRILQLNPKSTIAKIGLAEQYLKEGNIERAEVQLRGIDGPEQITDTNFLQYIEKNIHVSKKEEEKIAENTAEIKKNPQKKRIHKKKKKVRLPKNVQEPTPGFKPDPERWLPKWQRKGYKKKGKKGGGGKTQGLSTIGMEEKNVFFTGNSTSTKQVTKESKRRR